MLSSNIDAIRAQVEMERAKGRGITPEMMAHLSLIMAGWSRQARALEQVTIPPAARLDWSNLPAGVIPLPQRRPATRRHQGGADLPDGAA